jgi:hypothetical protein
VTYEELLVVINKYHSDIKSGLRWEPECFINALRTVVELHKPKDYKAGIWCIGCNADYEYPCPTIQAIEKELS